MSTDDLMAAFYGELRRLAAARLARSPGGARAQTLQATSLVHEAFVRLLGRPVSSYESERHFFFAAARAMQDIMVEHARRKARRDRLAPRGGGTDPLDAEAAAATDVIALTAALAELEAMHPRKVQLVRLRYFAGLTMAQAAEIMGVPVRTLEREWRLTRSILHVRLRRGESRG